MSETTIPFDAAKSTLAERTIEYTPTGEKNTITLSRSAVMRHVVSPTKSGAMPSEQEVTAFMALCKARLLNPYTKDAYLLGYDSQDGAKFSIITAKSALDKRAESHPEFDGYESGLVVLVNGVPVPITGAICPKSEWPNIVGAYCRVYRKDRSRPMQHDVNREVYDTKRSRWALDLPGMIIKCAEAGALRKAFPNEFAGMYLEEEVTSERVASGTVVDQQSQPKALPKGIEDLPLGKTLSAPTKEAVGKESGDPSPPPRAETPAPAAAAPAKAENAEVEVLIQLLERHGVPRASLLKTLKTMGFKVKSLDSLSQGDIEKISFDIALVVETYQAL
jgi:phage recombination protein Bet